VLLDVAQQPEGAQAIVATATASSENARGRRRGLLARDKEY
jgi:hypothetical protein